jgi:hypothetical protein
LLDIGRLAAEYPPLLKGGEALVPARPDRVGTVAFDRLIVNLCRCFYGSVGNLQSEDSVMARSRILLAVLGMLICCTVASAQSPGVLYTWPGTGNIADWTADGGNFTVLSNSTPGQLTATEMGDQLDPTIVGGEVFIHDSFQRRLESSTDIGGLDLTGLSYIEMDISHNNPTATVNVQFYSQVTPSYTYRWGGSDGMLQGPDWSLGPGPHTLRFPVNQLTAEGQTYILGIGADVRSHTSAGNLTWTISEVRAVGTPLTSRTIATHDAGTSENGFNGAYINFEGAAVQGGDGGQDQVGLTAGSGSLEWTDLGGGQGAAIGWGNGTAYNGNNYNERPLSAENYNQVIFRMKATDPLNQGGTIDVQSYFQNEAYADYQVPGTLSLPVDGQFHDLVFSLTGLHGMKSIDAFGVNLATHPNNAVIDVDLVRFATVQGVPGDYNNNGVVDAGDYVLWRKGGPLANEVDTPGTVNQADYTAWRARFGNTSGSGLAGGAVPEPTGILLLMSALVAPLAVATRRKNRRDGLDLV